MTITASQLGKILREEFDRADWGTVDPFYFEDPPKVGDGTEMDGLFEVLERAAERLNQPAEPSGRFGTLARNLCIAFIANQQGISLATAAKKIPGDVGPYWYSVADEVASGAMKAL